MKANFITNLYHIVMTTVISFYEIVKIVYYNNMH